MSSPTRLPERSTPARRARARRIRSLLGREAGLSLVEVISALVVFLIAGTALIQVVVSSNSAHGTALQNSLAEEAAQTELEQVRNLPYTSVGTQGGNPSGTVVASQTASSLGFVNLAATVLTAVSYVGDGIPGGYDQLTNYKKVTVTVRRLSDSLQLAQDVTYVAPPTKAAGSLAAIVVNVLDIGDNKPVSGVAIGLQTGPSAPESDTTNANGSVTFAGLTFNPTTGPQAYYNVVPTLPSGYQLSTGNVTQTQLSPSQTWATTIDVYQPATLNVNLSFNGMPYPGTASVLVTPATGTPQSYSISGGSGSIPLQIPNEQYTLSATTADGLVASAVTQGVPNNYPTDLTSTFNLTLIRPTGTLAVTVNQGGTPLAGATVMLTGGPNSVSLSATTNASGVATFTAVPVGTPGYTVSTTSGAAIVQQTNVLLTANQTTNVSLGVPVGSIQVTTTTSVPLAGATLALTGPNGFSASGGPTDASGKYTFANVPAGSGYAVVATSGGQTSQQAGIAVTSGGTTPVTLVFGGTLQVNVSAGGVPLSGQTVVVTGPNSFSASAATDASGNVSFSSVPSGSGYVATVTQGATVVVSPSQTITTGGVTSVSLTINAALSALAPTSGPVGTTGVTISATGFAASQALTVTVGGNPATITAGGTTAADGSATVTFTIPGAPHGAEAVVVSDGTSTVTSGTPFTVSSSASGLAPTSGPAGTTGVSIAVTGLAAAHALTVTVGGIAATITAGGTTSASGNATVTFTIPNAPHGAQAVVVSDGTNSATSPTPFTVTSSVTGLAPSSGASGSAGVTISAAGFIGSHALTVTVGGTAATITAGGTTAANGSATITFTLPALTGGSQAVVVSDGTNSATSPTPFTVNATLSGLAPTTGPAGTTGVTITATGFASSHALTVTVGGNAATITAGGTSAANGNATITFTIPSAPHGAQAVVVSDGTNSATSPTPFTVTATATGLAPTTGPVGTTGVTINASGFIASHALTVSVGGTFVAITSGGTTAANGATTVTFIIPSAPHGAQAVVVSDGTNSATSPTPFTVTATATGLAPTSGPPATTGVTITAAGFIGSHALTVTVGGTAATITAGGTTAANGGATVTFTIPALANGNQAVVVSDGTNSATSPTPFTVTSSVTGLAPSSGASGSAGVTISAAGFIGSHALTVTVGGTAATITAGGTTAANGSATITFTLPALTGGSQAVVVSDGTNSATSPTPFTVNATLSGLAPTTGPAGTTGVTITATGFASSHALTVTVGGNAATITAGGTSAANGNATITFTIPSAPHGAQAVVVSDGTNSATSPTPFTVTATATGLAPTTGPVGTTGVTINASGFIASHALTVSVGGTFVAITSGGTTAANGATTVTFIIPSAPHGAQAVVVSDGTNSATSPTPFTVTATATGLAPTSGPPATTGVTITAAGFIGSHALTVTVGGTAATITAGGTTAANGGATVTFTIPALANGNQAVVVSDGTNSATSPTPFTVTPAVNAPSPASGPVGTSVTITGSNFIASHALTIKVGGTTATITAGATSSGTGTANATFTIPSLAAGSYAVTVSDGTNTGVSATQFTVTTPTVAAPSPASGLAGTTGVTIAGSNFIPSAALTIKVGGTTATITAGATASAGGAVAATFTIPALALGSYSVTVSDGVNTVTSGTQFVVTGLFTGTSNGSTVAPTTTFGGACAAATCLFGSISSALTVSSTATNGNTTPAATTVSHLSVTLSGNVSGGAITFTVMKNGATAGGPTCTVPNGSSTCTDTVTQEAFNGSSDTINIRMTKAAGAQTAVSATWTLQHT